MLKILFQEPIVSRNVTFGKFEAGAGNNTFPYGVASISQYILDKGHQVKYLEPNIEQMNLEEYKNYLLDNNFDVIGMSSTTLQIGKTIETFKLIKEINSNIITVLGGIHGTIMPTETLKETNSIDYIILGEGEKPFAGLLECIENNLKETKNIKGIAFKNKTKIVVNPPDYNDMLKIEELPTPSYHLFPIEKYIPQATYTKAYPTYSIIASRGCPFNCAFCNCNDIFGRRNRYKEVDRFIDEILTLKNKYGAKGLIFWDSTFTVNNEWVKQFCKRYIERKVNLPWTCCSRVDTINEELMKSMKKAGCWKIQYGIESANQKSLDLINKGTTVEQNTKILKLSMKLGISAYATYIICLPEETKKDVLNTIKYAKKMATPTALFYLPVPFPKTELWNICKEKGILREDAKWEDYNSWDWKNPVYINPLIGKEKMKKLLKYAYFSYYLTPKVIYGNLKELILFKQDIRKYIYAVKALSGLKN